MSETRALQNLHDSGSKIMRLQNQIPIALSPRENNINGKQTGTNGFIRQTGATPKISKKEETIDIFLDIISIMNSYIPSDIASWTQENSFDISDQNSFDELVLSSINTFPPIQQVPQPPADLITLKQIQNLLLSHHFVQESSSTGVLQFTHPEFDKKITKDNFPVSIIENATTINPEKLVSTRNQIPPPELYSFTVSNRVLDRNLSKTVQVQLFLEIPETALDIVFVIDAAWVAQNMATKVESKNVSVFRVATMAVSNVIRNIPLRSQDRIAIHVVDGQGPIDSKSEFYQFSSIASDLEKEKILNYIDSLGEITIRQQSRNMPFELSRSMREVKEMKNTAKHPMICFVLISEKAPKSVESSLIPDIPVYIMQLPGESSLKENNFERSDIDAARKLSHATKGMLLTMQRLDQPKPLANCTGNSMLMVINSVRKFSFRKSLLSIRPINGSKILRIATRLGTKEIDANIEKDSEDRPKIGPKESFFSMCVHRSQGLKDFESNRKIFGQNCEELWPESTLLAPFPTTRAIEHATADSVSETACHARVRFIVEFEAPSIPKSNQFTDQEAELSRKRKDLHDPAALYNDSANSGCISTNLRGAQNVIPYLQVIFQ
ncbi:hypothetical protein HK096_002748, partial [Nowakowskiella sp. JEL0078]